jgi:hypothetical protein
MNLMDKALDLAQQCGGLAALEKLVDRLADMQRWWVRRMEDLLGSGCKCN